MRLFNANDAHADVAELREPPSADDLDQLRARLDDVERRLARLEPPIEPEPPARAPLDSGLVERLAKRYRRDGLNNTVGDGREASAAQERVFEERRVLRLLIDQVGEGSESRAAELEERSATAGWTREGVGPSNAQLLDRIVARWTSPAWEPGTSLRSPRPRVPFGLAVSS